MWAELYRGLEIDKNCGFYLEAEHLEGKEFRLVMESETRKAVFAFSLDKMAVQKEKIARYYQRGLRHLRTYGVKALADKAMSKWKNRKNRPMDYQTWRQKKMPSEAELKQQKHTKFPYMPKISIIVPLYRTAPHYLQQAGSFCKGTDVCQLGTVPVGWQRRSGAAGRDPV